MKYFYLACVSLGISLSVPWTPASAASVYKEKYFQLNMRDYDDMNRMVDSAISKAQNTFSDYEDKGLVDEGIREATGLLRAALVLVFSRPNTENMIAKLINGPRRELGNYSAFEKTVDSIAVQAINTIKDKNAHPDDKGTAITILQNIMSEFKPGLNAGSLLLDTMKKIRDANLDFDKKVISERRKNMYSTPDLSKEAKGIVAAAEKIPAQKKTPPPPKPKDDEDGDIEQE